MKGLKAASHGVNASGVAAIVSRYDVADKNDIIHESPYAPILATPPPPAAVLDSKLDSASDESGLEAEEMPKLKGKQKKKQVVRKSTGSLLDLKDLTDVICSNILIFQNTKNRKNLVDLCGSNQNTFESK